MKRVPDYPFSANVGGPRIDDGRWILFPAPYLQSKVHVPFFPSIDKSNAVNCLVARTPDRQKQGRLPQLVYGARIHVGQRHGVHADVLLVLPRQGNTFLVQGHGSQVFDAGLGEGSPSKIVRHSKRQRRFWKMLLKHVPKCFYGRDFGKVDGVSPVAVRFDGKDPRLGQSVDTHVLFLFGCCVTLRFFFFFVSNKPKK